MILAVALSFLWCRSSSDLLVEALGAAPPPRQLAEDGSDSNGGDGGFPVVHERPFLGNAHQGKYSRFPVLPGAWTDGEVGQCHPASGVYMWRKWGFGSNINRK